jgi:hypothetical protein
MSCGPTPQASAAAPSKSGKAVEPMPAVKKAPILLGATRRPLQADVGPPGFARAKGRHALRCCLPWRCLTGLHPPCRRAFNLGWLSSAGAERACIRLHPHLSHIPQASPTRATSDTMSELAVKLRAAQRPARELRRLVDREGGQLFPAVKKAAILGPQSGVGWKPLVGPWPGLFVSGKAKCFLQILTTLCVRRARALARLVQGQSQAPDWKPHEYPR